MTTLHDASTTADSARHDEMLRAFERGDVFALEQLHRNHGLGGLEGVSIDVLASRGQLDALRFLCDHANATFTTQAIDGAATNGHLGVVQYLQETHHAPYTANAMDLAAENAHWTIVLYLLENQDEEWEVLDRTVDQPSIKPYTTRVLDAAALDGRLDLVRQFHVAGLPCSTWAMDMAAACGHLEVVRFLHSHRHEGCTTHAMDEAARDRHADVVRFLHENRTEGCTTQAMDHAAGNGDLELVKFFHTRRTEGCTTNAIDLAAANGHADVVEFLLLSRSEGFTCQAVEMVAKLGCEKSLRGNVFRRASAMLIGDHRHIKILHLLFRERPDLFDPAIMPSLLLCGAFDVWLEMRQAFPDFAGEEQAMMLAGERGHLSTIRFLRDVCGRRDLLHLALEGAVRERPSWLTALYRDDPYGSYDYNLYHPSDATDFTPSDPWLPHSFFLEQGIPDWMIEQSLIDYDLRQQNLQGDEYPCHWTWPIWAIYRHDLATLEVLKNLEATAENMCDPRFSFDDARSHAIRVGRLDILQWLFREIPHVAIEPTLLDDAIFYGQLEIAKWLAQFYPQACEAFPGAKSWPLAPLGVRISSALLGELENDEWLRKRVDFGAVAAYVAEQGNLPLLQRLFARYPASVLARTDILDRTIVLNGGCCDLTMLEYLRQIRYTHASPLAMDSVTHDSQLEILRFLYEHYRHGDSTVRGILDAAKNGSWSIVLFHLQQRGLSSQEREAVVEVILANVADEWASRLLQLIQAQQKREDDQLAAEWLSDSEM